MFEVWDLRDAGISVERAMNPKIQTRKPNSPKYGASLHIRTFCAMLRMLHDGDVTKTELMDELGLASGTVVKWLKLLGSEDQNKPGRLVYVSGWTRPGSRGNYAAQWSYGFEMLDAPKPKPMTSAQYARRYRLRKTGALQLVLGGKK